MKKNLILVSSSLLLSSGMSFSHKNYENYTGKKFITYGKTSLSNKYSLEQNNAIRMYPKRKLEHVDLYTSTAESAPKIQMKIFTKAPVGTKVELHLSKRGEISYPAGVHSVFQAYTSCQNAWEELTFSFSHAPTESLVKANEIDQLVLMFAPEHSGYAINSMES
jgi:hypothetical protein